MLKQIIISALWIASLALIPFGVQAQYDDLYYNPSDYNQTTSTSSSVNSSQDLSFGDSHYDDQSYEHFDDYDFYYSSRIRRFHRPVRSMDFYDPYFVDLAYYGYARPGVTIYVTSYPYRSRGFYHHHHWHHYDPFYNPYYSWHHRPYRPYRPFGYSSYGFGFGYGYNTFGGYGYSPCPVFYASNSYYVNNYYTNTSSSQQSDVSSRGSHYGPRSTAGGTTARNGRAAADNKDEGVRPPTPSEERTAIGSNRNNTAETRTGNQFEGEVERPTRIQGESATTPTQRRGDRNTEVASGAFSPRERDSRQAQNQFRDNRVTRDQAHADIRSNVPPTRTVERRGSDSGVRGDRGINTNPPQPRTRGANPRGSIRNDQPRNNHTNEPSRINRGSDNNNQGSFNTPRSNNRSSRSSGVTPSRSSGNNSSSGVTPSRSNSGSSNSGNTRSSRSGRGG